MRTKSKAGLCGLSDGGAVQRGASSALHAFRGGAIILASGDDDEKDRARDAEMDEDSGDLSQGTDEDALDRDELDTDRVTSVEALAAGVSAHSHSALFLVFPRMLEEG